jgi:hypothetical protein
MKTKKRNLGLNLKHLHKLKRLPVLIIVPSEFAFLLTRINKVRFSIFLMLAAFATSLLSEVVATGGIADLQQSLIYSSEVIILLLVIMVVFSTLFFLVFRLFRIKINLLFLIINSLLLGMFSFIIQQCFIILVNAGQLSPALANINFNLVNDIGLVLILSWHAQTFIALVKQKAELKPVTEVLSQLAYLAVLLLVIGT